MTLYVSDSFSDVNFWNGESGLGQILEKRRKDGGGSVEEGDGIRQLEPKR